MCACCKFTKIILIKKIVINIGIKAFWHTSALKHCAVKTKSLNQK
jgi:hypothetical protein